MSLSAYVIARNFAYWRFPSSTERLAYAATPVEVTKVAWQVSDNTFWVLLASPGTWIELATIGNSGDYITQIADGAIGGHRVVRPTTTGKVGYVNQATSGQAARALGITQGAAADLGSINVQYNGKMTDVSFAWTVDAAIYCGVSGVLTQTAPTSGMIIQVGVALTATSFLIDLKQPIQLS